MTVDLRKLHASKFAIDTPLRTLLGCSTQGKGDGRNARHAVEGSLMHEGFGEESARKRTLGRRRRRWEGNIKIN